MASLSVLVHQSTLASEFLPSAVLRLKYSSSPFVVGNMSDASQPSTATFDHLSCVAVWEMIEQKW